MKKTLITLLTLGGLAMGATTAEYHSTSTAATSMNTTLTLSATDTTAVLDTTSGNETDLYTTYQGRNSVYAANTIVLTLNLTAMEEAAVTENTALLTIDSATDYGLYLTSAGLVGRWGNGTNGTAKSLAVLLSNDNVCTWEGNKLLTVAASFNGSNTYANMQGVSLVAADGSLVWQSTGLASENNATFDAITIDTRFVSAIMVKPEILAQAELGNAANYLQTMVPEPATATLSLLALAGLAARRRRK